MSELGSGAPLGVVILVYMAESAGVELLSYAFTLLLGAG